MPELPDITVYAESLAAKVRGDTLNRVKIASPFLLRTAVPPITSAEGKRVVGTRRVGKRVVIALDGALFLVIHLMIAGRLHWHAALGKAPAKTALATSSSTAARWLLTEAGTQRRASLHLVARPRRVAGHGPRRHRRHRTATAAEFAAQLAAENHTLKRSLTNPQLFSGIGNAYSDEILHRARLSPWR